MKIILGIDLQQAYVPALHLLASLEFKDPEIILVQASPTVDSMLPPFPVDGTTVDLLQTTIKQAAESALLSAGAEAKKLGLSVLPLVCVGPSAELLNECVESESAQLVALRTTHHGAWESEFMGSVSRTVLLCGKVSVLIAKKEPLTDTPLEIVFAADGSEFNDRCLDQFLSMRPSGVGTIHVVSAWGLASDLERLFRHAFHHSDELNSKLGAAARSASDRAAARLNAAGYKTTAAAIRGLPDKVLREAMTALNADLLVLGAHGKNWVERLLLGSTSLHQVINEPYNVLVLRP